MEEHWKHTTDTLQRRFTKERLCEWSVVCFQSLIGLAHVYFEVILNPKQRRF